MTLTLKNKDTIEINEFIFKCCIGKNGKSKKKIEGDKKTPIGIFGLGDLYYRADRFKKPFTSLKSHKINKNMAWCNDVNHKKYNKLIKINKKIGYEKLFRKDHKYDLIVPIKYNFNKPVKNRGSAIFLHLTKNYKPTAGCIALKEKDFLVMLNLIDKKTKILIS